MDFHSVIIILKDIVLTCAAGMAIYVAYTGLNKWKKELDGKSHFETAHEFLEGVYCLRTAIHSVRECFISRFEIPEGRELNQKEKYLYIFKQRWGKIELALEKLDLSKYRAQSFWGKEFEEVVTPLYELVGELNLAINRFIETLPEEVVEGGSISANLENMEFADVVFHIPALSGRHASFSDRLHRTIRDLEEKVRGYGKI